MGLVAEHITTDSHIVWCYNDLFRMHSEVGFNDKSAKAIDY